MVNRKICENPSLNFGLDYHLMTQFTSFVAVEDRMSLTEGGKAHAV